MEDTTNKSSVWTKVLSSVMSLPGVTIDRDRFLREMIAPFYGADKAEKAVAGKPLDVLTIEEVDMLATNCIQKHRNEATLASAATGLPGGPIGMGLISVDIAQYYSQCVKVSQKLGYLYGIPSLLELDGSMSNEGLKVISTYIAVMSGAKMANNVLVKLMKELAEQAVRRISQVVTVKALSSGLFRQVAKYLGTRITAQSAGKVVQKAIPLIGAGISGGVTHVLFSLEANRLKKQLRAAAQSL